MPKFIYAASSVIFLSILLVSLIILGDREARLFSFVALFSAALSQFIAQDADSDIRIYWVSIIWAYAAIVFTVAAIVAFA